MKTFKQFIESILLNESTKEDIQSLCRNALKFLDTPKDDDFQIAITVLADFLENHCHNQYKADMMRTFLNRYIKNKSDYNHDNLFETLMRGQNFGFITSINSTVNPDYITAITIQGVAPDYESPTKRRNYIAYAKVKDSTLNECYNLQMTVTDYTKDYGSIVEREPHQLYIFEATPTRDQIRHEYLFGEQTQINWDFRSNDDPMRRYLKKGHPPTNNDDYGTDFFEHLYESFETLNYVAIENDLGLADHEVA
jgi:hypothetical protein